MNTLTRNALPIILTTALLCACGGGGGGGSGGTGGTGSTNPTGNTGGTNDPGGTGNPGNTGTSGNDGGSGTTGGNTNTGGDADNSGDPDDTTFPDQHPEQPLGTAEGVYAGALTGGTYSDSKSLILENGQYWSLYGEDSGSFFTVYGFIQGSGISADGTYSASDLRDFGSSPANAGTMTAEYDATAETLDGTWAFANVAEIQFTGGEITNSPYDYDTPADIATAVGHWDGTSAAGPSVAITVNADGSFNMVEGQCVSTGTMKPRASGKNVFNLTIKFGDAPCAMANETAKGVAITYPLTTTGEMQLMAAVVSSSRTQGVAFFGIRD
jgi:hypothetical protein